MSENESTPLTPAMQPCVKCEPVPLTVTCRAWTPDGELALCRALPVSVCSEPVLLMLCSCETDSIRTIWTVPHEACASHDLT